MALKLDMNKAYDRVEWDFLEAALLRFGFSEAWVRLIMACVTTVTFSIVLNGKAGKPFTPTRGLRQGDPLSPYLFLIVSEVLSLRISKAVRDNHVKGIRLCRGCPVISHLFFADDSLFFLKATLDNAWNFSQLLKTYCTASGQLVNKEKSSIYFSPNTPNQMAMLICELMSFREVDDPGVYLGLPTIWGRSKKEALSYILDRVERKLEGWKEKTLSWAGKEVLIKAVAMAIPSFPMSCFLLPVGFCRKLNSLISDFWWGFSNTGKKIHWVAWDQLSKAKEEGGLGFKNLHHHNIALLGKQCWRILSNPSSLCAKILKARYFPKCGFLEAVKGHRPSWVWSSLVAARDKLLRDCNWIIGNGKLVSVWGDPWIPIQGGEVLQHPPIVREQTMVESLIDWRNHRWELNAIQNWISEDTAQAIGNIPLGNPEDQDLLCWPHATNGSYSVKIGYQVVHLDFLRSLPTPPSSSHRTEKQLWKIIWKINCPPKIRLFLWRAISNAGPTMENLHHRKLSNSPTCQICNQASESFTHALILCPWVSTVWFGSNLGVRVHQQSITTLDHWITTIYSQIPSTVNKDSVLTTCAYLIWLIWKERCSFMYNGRPVNPLGVISSAASLALEYREVAGSLNTHQSGSSTPSRWAPPPLGKVKINVDASWFSDSNGKVGAIIRDHNCSVIAGRVDRIKASCSMEAEAMALQMGTDLALAGGYREVIFESDSLHAITDLNLKKCSNWKAYQILNQIRSRSSAFDSCEWRWVPRKANVAAHTAAQLAFRGEGPLLWTNQPPLMLVDVLRNDGLTGPPPVQ